MAQFGIRPFAVIGRRFTVPIAAQSAAVIFSPYFSGHYPPGGHLHGREQNLLCDCQSARTLAIVGYWYSLQWQAS
jgi:hypothetical protein